MSVGTEEYAALADQAERGFIATVPCRDDATGSFGTDFSLHAASLQLLEHTGVLVDHPEARDLLLSAGATLDEAGRVLIPSHLVHEGLRRVLR